MILYQGCLEFIRGENRRLETRTRQCRHTGGCERGKGYDFLHEEDQ